MDAIQLSPGIRDYIQKVAVDEPDVMRRLREETAADAYASMQISPDVGQLMRFLVHSLGIKRSLEVGVFTGYSSLSVALAMPDDGRIIACDVSEQWTSIARRYWQEAGVAHKVDLRLAPAIQTLDALIAARQEGQFDFAFIDADKANYWNYYERAIRLVRQGGVIAIDNVLWDNKVIDPSVNDEDTVAIRQFNERLHADARVFVTMLAIRDGVTLAWKR